MAGKHYSDEDVEVKTRNKKNLYVLYVFIKMTNFAS